MEGEIVAADSRIDPAQVWPPEACGGEINFTREWGIHSNGAQLRVGVEPILHDGAGLDEVGVWRARSLPHLCTEP